MRLKMGGRNVGVLLTFVPSGLRIQSDDDNFVGDSKHSDTNVAPEMTWGSQLVGAFLRGRALAPLGHARSDKLRKFAGQEVWFTPAGVCCH